MKQLASYIQQGFKTVRTRAMHLGLVMVLTLMCLTGAAQSQCGYEWQEGFHLPGADGPVHASVVFDDGSGPALYIGGQFEHIGTVPARGIARWNGREWQAVGGGLGHAGEVIYVLYAENDGDISRLIIGGSFSNVGQITAMNIAQWDGVAWSTFGLGTSGPVMAVTTYDDGRGPAYFVGGDFDAAGGIPARNIAKWNGVTWSALGAGILEESPNYDSLVRALEVFDEDADGPLPPRLFVGGRFWHAGPAYTASLARWNGVAWSKVTTSSAGWLPGGVGGTVMALQAFDPDNDGPQPRVLYIGGLFGGPYSDLPSYGIVAWSGSQWIQVGALPVTASGGIASFAVDHSTTSPQLLVAGQFSSISGVPAANIARLSNDGWLGIGDPNGPAAPVSKTVAAVNDPILGEPFILAGGDFNMVDGLLAGGMMKWDGHVWTPFGSGLGLGGDWHQAAAWFDDGTGPALWVGTQYLGYGNSQPCFSRLQGGHWNVPDSRIHGDPRRLDAAVLPGQTTEKLIAVGNFEFPESDIDTAVIVWTGTQWEPLGAPISGLAQDFAILHDQSGAPMRVFIAGQFSVNAVLELRDGAWVPLDDQPNDSVIAIEAFDDGDGESLFVGAYSVFETLLRWDGNQWTVVDGCPTFEFTDGGSGLETAYVTSLEVGTDSQGKALFVGGHFALAGYAPAAGVARWDGLAWSDMAGGLRDGNFPGWGTRLSVFNSGEGLRLLVAGAFDRAGSVAAQQLACWDGSQWFALSGELFDDGVRATAVETDIRTGTESLFLVGDFSRVGTTLSHHIAKWAPADLPPQVVLQPDDRTRPPGGTTTFSVTIESGAAAYQWLRDSSPLVDDERITGSQAATLAITNLQKSDAGQYNVVITNDCGEATTEPATLLVRAQCSGDITGINGAVDMADFQMVVNAWGPCPGCAADTNGDGLVNIDDLLTVISQWGPCP